MTSGLDPRDLAHAHLLALLRASALTSAQSGLPWLKLARYGLVGVGNSLAYAGVVALLVQMLAADPRMASALAYLAVLPLAYWGHRRVTFCASGSVWPQISRFLASQAANMALSVLGMALMTETLDLPYGYGIAAAIILVPVVNYLLLDRWVFQPRRA